MVHLNKKIDIFSVKCASGSNDWNCCSSSSQCGLGEGDCDYDSDCAGDLVCGRNNCADGDFGLDCCTAAGMIDGSDIIMKSDEIDKVFK